MVKYAKTMKYSDKPYFVLKIYLNLLRDKMKKSSKINYIVSLMLNVAILRKCDFDK